MKDQVSQQYKTNSTEQISWEANSNSASQEIPRLLWNPEVQSCSLQTATGSYPEPDAPSPHLFP